MSPLEQARRDFKGSSPELYAYIEKFIEARTWEDAGDLTSGAMRYGASNLCYLKNAEAKERLEEMERA